MYTHQSIGLKSKEHISASIYNQYIYVYYISGLCVACYYAKIA